MSPARHHHALPEGYHLHWYEIDSILGQGGFGITYLARDSNLDQLVAIKEFLPSDLAVRTQDSTVQPLTGDHSDTYGWGLNRFLTEARTLAKFRHPNIVRVMSVFEANNTAYMVMEYEHGESFENMLKFKQVGGEQALKEILLALLDGLELVHDSGFIHRDIKPSNVYLREDGVPVLLDFGSARLALGVETRTLTSLVSPGYAPFEQYNATRESDKQGPWTDIYALGATMYRAVTGQGPIDAAARANLLLDEQRDPFQPCSQMGLENYSLEFLHAIDRALAFPPGERPQSVATWRQLVVTGAVDTEAETMAVGSDPVSGVAVDYVLDGGDGAAAPAAAATGRTVRTLPMAEIEAEASPPQAQSSARGWIVAAVVIVALAAVTVAAWLSLAPPEQAATPAPEKLAAATQQPSPAPGAGSEPAAQPPSAGDSIAMSATQDTTRAPATEKAVQQPSAPVVEKPVVTSAPAAEKTVETKSAAAAEKPAETKSAPAAEKKVEKKQAPADPPPAPAKKTAPEKVAKAAPAPAPTSKKKTPQAAPAKKKDAPPKPRTREEKIAALLISADKHLAADRLTKPKKDNALRDYLTVLAMDKHNDAARQGVEQVVERYVAKAEHAIGAARYDEANGYLKSARFVLDAMKLRKWPQSRYNALFADYREANRLLANAR